MFIMRMSASATVIAAALIAAPSAFAQETPAPVGPQSTTSPATPAPTTDPAPRPTAPPPQQPGTTTVPPSDPAIPPQAGGPQPTDPGQAGAPADNAADPADSGVAAGPPAADATTPAGPETSSAAPAAPAQPAANGAQVAAFVDAQFPALDSDGDGALTTTEFEGWITKLKTTEIEASGKAADTAEVKSYARNAVLTADKDADQKITRAEATQFFSG